MKVAFQGVHGAYSDLAAHQLFGARTGTVPFAAFEDVFNAVHAGKVDRGLIPIENSLAGSIHQNYDLLVQHQLGIVGETYLRVEHALLCHPAAEWKKIRSVRSHPQALAQCSHFFAEHPKVKPEVYFDTAGAAESLAKEKPDAIAAIASEYAGKLYGLKILRRGLQNQAVNYTRFLAIAPLKRIGKKAGGVQKTSITLIPKHNAEGVLFRLLGVFALRNIDLTKIESRPNPAKPFEYRFYLDLAGGVEEPRIAKALDQVGEMVAELRVLGSYARAALPKID